MRDTTYSPSWNLNTIPDSVWHSENGRRRASHSTGRLTLSECPGGCGRIKTGTQLYKKCECGYRKKKAGEK